jgi:oligopeptide/dipeptide ABC transporter ATP-binding protein
VTGLTISVERHGRRIEVVRDVSLEVPPGGSLGIVGESGSGKSLTLRALMGLLPPGVRVDAGRAELGGVELPLSGRSAHVARRRRVAMIFQDPLSALDPVHTIGSQVAEVPQRVLGRSRRASRERAIELLRMVGLPAPERRYAAYPHQLSGGMRQRVLIAMALAAEPSLLLCDEPTTALDVTVQAQVLELLDQLRRRLGLSLVFVSHDLAVVRQVCERAGVMYAGRLLETGATADLLDAPAHPYTLALLEAVVDLDDPLGAPQPIPGSIPDPTDPPSGCPFHPRCSFATPDCADCAIELRPPTEVVTHNAAAVQDADRAHAAPQGAGGPQGAPIPSQAGPLAAPLATPRPSVPADWADRLTACLHPERLLDRLAAATPDGSAGGDPPAVASAGTQSSGGEA